ncbi:MAG TPA: thiol:disulfide interchange protein DsbA/DsbL [Rhodoferax sp.]|jgi:thiol:disulfide interchange protein DsbA|nr:thiol:disulfide interchange protein DsbA/DsbL [Rhodoferax sp.]
MKRRDFSRMAASSALLASLAPVMVQAQGKKPVPGTDYQVLDPRAPVEAPAGKIEVVEFFWYNCPHCATLEPTLNEWVKRLPKDVAFRRVPRRFADGEVPQQQLYYALESMGLVDKLHAKVFAAVHGERRNLNRPEAIADWVAAQGVDRAKFMGQFSSFSVVTKATKAAQLQNAYRVDGVPALGVAGRFLTDGQMAGSNERALQVVESLIADVRAGR